MICPACRSENTMTTSDGGALCFECRNEWDPTQLVAGPAPVIAPFAMASVEEVFGPPPGVELDPPPFEMDDLLGQIATLEGGQQMLITETDGFGPITGVTPSGDTLHVPLSDVVSVVPLPELDPATTDVHEGDQQEEAT